MIETTYRVYTRLAAPRACRALIAGAMSAYVAGCHAHHHHDHHHDHDHHQHADHADRAVNHPATLAEARPAEVRNMLAADPDMVYLDVRTVAEFEEGHVPGSLNIPVLFLEGGKKRPNDAFLREVSAHVPRNAKVIVGCRSGGRSAMAGNMMLKAGYRDVTNMLGGFHGKKSSGKTIEEGWNELGYESETGTGGPKSYEALRVKP